VVILWILSWWERRVFVVAVYWLVKFYNFTISLYLYQNTDRCSNSPGQAPFTLAVFDNNSTGGIQTNPVKLPRSNYPGQTTPVKLPRSTLPRSTPITPVKLSRSNYPGQTTPVNFTLVKLPWSNYPGQTTSVKLPRSNYPGQLYPGQHQLPWSNYPGQTTLVKLPQSTLPRSTPTTPSNYPGQTTPVKLPRSNYPGQTTPVKLPWSNYPGRNSPILHVDNILEILIFQAPPTYKT
jgi:hypothetical protein